MWSQWKAEKCQSARHFLYEKYQQWAEIEASCWQKRLCNVEADRDDFCQYAQVGLLEAMESFELDKGVMFKSYAQHRIRGSIFNNVFRFSDNSAYKNKIYYQSSEGTMSVDELIEANGLVGAIEELALEYLLENTHEEQTSCVSGYYYSSDEMQRLKAHCISALSLLDEPKATIISLYYRFEKSLTEIADILGLSVGRVSQLRKLALLELSDILEQK
ncbi:sigma-70 family RNA polymerase sigma factor [Pseudoalteromonas byunsanensis]|uniref:sigma-70 family RNA polymerase sigma factor n=1 Tax=Pseudoalteromonas byunsanensis TaxID=327939 RepID=UPI001586DD9A|nr:sigma-70 family RNA polymerase sigma factor [Pseudoalteromonas byunsanensis]